MALALVLGDQLSLSISSLQHIDKANDTVVMAEVQAEAEYAPHHRKKLVFIFSCMRHFAQLLRSEGYRVDYQQLDDQRWGCSLLEVLQNRCAHYQANQIYATKASEHRLVEAMQGWQNLLTCSLKLLEDDRFFATPQQFATWAKQQSSWTMESFYRLLRKKTGILMDGNVPAGGQWNYDKANRKPLDHRPIGHQPADYDIDEITAAVIEMVEDKFPYYFGDIHPFTWAVTTEDAEHALREFIDYRLPLFGDYQDAMTRDDIGVYHAQLSHYLNIGLLDVRLVCDAIEQAYRDNRVPINAAEGAIRQLLGWREYVRGVYFYCMPEFANQNYLATSRELPAIYWGRQTQMQCLGDVVHKTKQHAYSHHIERLMVTGNFALLIGANVPEAQEWYLAVYADAYEWVDMPNVIGMALYADGGRMATKPYAASGTYIHRMSDYCDSCHYNVKAKTGDDACPYNYLYWNFLEKHRDKLAENPRMKLVYANLDNQPASQRQAIKQSAEKFLAKLDQGDSV